MFPLFPVWWSTGLSFLVDSYLTLKESLRMFFSQREFDVLPYKNIYLTPKLTKFPESSVFL